MRISVPDDGRRHGPGYNLDRDPSHESNPPYEESDVPPQIVAGLPTSLVCDMKTSTTASRPFAGIPQGRSNFPQERRGAPPAGVDAASRRGFHRGESHFQSAVAAGSGRSEYLPGLRWPYLDNHVEEAPQALAERFRGEPAVAAAALLGLGAAGAVWRANGSGRLPDGSNRPQLLEEMPISAAADAGHRLAARSGRPRRAQQSAPLAVLAVDPLNHAALHELCDSWSGVTSEAVLQRMLARRSVSISSDLACFYLGAGLPEDALDVLEEAERSWRYPMRVLPGSLHPPGKLEQKKKPTLWLEKAAQVEPDLCFPSRLEEVKALQSRVYCTTPTMTRPATTWALFYYAHQRFDDGVQLWQQALQGLSELSTCSTATWGWLPGSGIETAIRAIELFEKALELNPPTRISICHLDDLYKAEGMPEKREQLAGNRSKACRSPGRRAQAQAS